MRWYILIILLVYVCKMTVGQKATPCPDIFNYLPREEEDRWYGSIKLELPTTLRGVWIHFTLDRKAELFGNWFGQVTSTDNQEYAIKMPKYRLQAQKELEIRLFVKYNTGEAIPSLANITLNGILICPEEDLTSSASDDVTTEEPTTIPSSITEPSTTPQLPIEPNNDSSQNPSSTQSIEPAIPTTIESTVSVSTNNDVNLTQSNPPSNFNQSPNQWNNYNNNQWNNNYNNQQTQPPYNNNYNQGNVWNQQQPWNNNYNQQGPWNNNYNNQQQGPPPNYNNYQQGQSSWGSTNNPPTNQWTNNNSNGPQSGNQWNANNPPGNTWNNYNQPGNQWNNNNPQQPPWNNNNNNNNNPYANNYFSQQQQQNQPPPNNYQNPNNNDYQNWNPSPSTNQPAYFTGDHSIWLSSSSTSTTIPQNPLLLNSKCGTVAVKANPLIAFGQSTIKGQWPWHVALYYSQGGLQLTYTCGASLISERYLLTAAHCVTVPHSAVAIDPKMVIAYLGKYGLNTFGSDIQDREIEQIVVNPAYNYTVFYSDIAILRLTMDAIINNYVRPVCLWDGPSDIDSIVNKLGTVVGWGFDETHQLSHSLMQAEMPVVSTLTCIYSNRDFFSQFTFDNNYCAGFRNGTSVCNGDSGGGMVFPKEGSPPNEPIWQLRGLVSVGVALQGQGICDTSHFIIFTDVAKHLDWIRSTTGIS